MYTPTRGAKSDTFTGCHFTTAAFSNVQMLPFEIREQLNLTLVRPYLTFKASAQT